MVRRREPDEVDPPDFFFDLESAAKQFQNRSVSSPAAETTLSREGGVWGELNS